MAARAFSPLHHLLNRGGKFLACRGMPASWKLAATNRIAGAGRLRYINGYENTR
jgi:hypothetical protein